ncbi:hypothetical protein CC2G_009982 [Coprinopsis cinerea AmutBmut pab1-1]|nr:hypothetical protein CC2G_009982 [Coprinopsis cinerea AmutBmut pab1-1]
MNMGNASCDRHSLPYKNRCAARPKPNLFSFDLQLRTVSLALLSIPMAAFDEAPTAPSPASYPAFSAVVESNGLKVAIVDHENVRQRVFKVDCPLPSDAVGRGDVGNDNQPAIHYTTEGGGGSVNEGGHEQNNVQAVNLNGADAGTDARHPNRNRARDGIVAFFLGFVLVNLLQDVVMKIKAVVDASK